MNSKVLPSTFWSQFCFYSLCDSIFLFFFGDEVEEWCHMHLLNFNSFLITKYIEAFSVLFLSNDIRHFFIVRQSIFNSGSDNFVNTDQFSLKSWWININIIIAQKLDQHLESFEGLTTSSLWCTPKQLDNNYIKR